VNNPSDEISQAERRRVMLEERKASTYLAQAQASIGDELGGRFAQSGSSATVIGSSPISYPQQPSTSPAMMPVEPPLGYAIDGQEPVGEKFEVERSRNASTQVGVGGGPTQASGTTDGRPAIAKFRRRF